MSDRNRLTSDVTKSPGSIIAKEQRDFLLESLLQCLEGEVLSRRSMQRNASRQPWIDGLGRVRWVDDVYKKRMLHLVSRNTSS